MQNPAISIIVPVYNVEKYLSQCLDSIITQTLTSIEIVCVNDGSTDGSLAILNSYAEKDKRVIVIDQVNKGLSGARNAGVQVAQGEFLMFVDSDDWLDVKTCEDMYSLAVSNDADSVMFTYTKEFKNHSTINHTMKYKFKVFEANDLVDFYRRLIGPIKAELGKPQDLDLYVSACMQLFKTSCVKNIKFHDTKQVGTEDLLYQLEVYQNVKKFVYIDKPYYHYRRSEYGTLTTSYMPDKFNRWINLQNRIKKIIGDVKNQSFQEALDNRIALSCLGLGLNEVCNKANICVKSKKYHHILSSSPYFEALKSLQIHFMPVHWRLFYFLCKHRQAFLAMLMLECIEYLRTHKH